MDLIIKIVKYSASVNGMGNEKCLLTLAKPSLIF